MCERLCEKNICTQCYSLFESVNVVIPLIICRQSLFYTLHVIDDEQILILRKHYEYNLVAYTCSKQQDGWSLTLEANRVYIASYTPPRSTEQDTLSQKIDKN